MGTGLRRCGETGKHAGMTEDVVISAQGLTKRYGATIAVDHIDLDVRAGTIAGILAPNESGKPTTSAARRREEFRGLGRGVKGGGTAVLLSCHHLDQVQSVCDRVALFNRGRIALSGSVTELAQRVLGGGYVIDVEARGEAVRNQLAAVPGVVRVQALGPQLHRVDFERDLRAEIARRLAPSFDLLGIRFAEPSLNEVYTRYFDEVRDAA